LEILDELPITNRNTITKSKVLDVVAEWAKIPQDVKTKIERYYQILILILVAYITCIQNDFYLSIITCCEPNFKIFFMIFFTYCIESCFRLKLVFFKN